MMDPEDKLLTLATAAERLAVSVATLRRAIARGELPAVRIGSGPRARIRIEQTALRRFVGLAVDESRPRRDRAQARRELELAAVQWGFSEECHARTE